MGELDVNFILHPLSFILPHIEAAMTNLNRTEREGVTVLRLDGSLTQEEVLNVERSFHDATHRDGAAVVVDLSNVDFLATPAIAMFLEAAITLRDSGGRIVVSGPQPRIDQILKCLKLDRVLPVCSTVDEGVNIVKK